MDRLRDILREHFGFEDYRGIQREVIEHVLAGRDALVVMPTGSGKSLLYQVPALALERPTLVLSPLIALMKDQVDALRAKGIPASFVNSTLDRRAREKRTRAFVEGRLRLLYVTPERFRREDFRAAIDGVDIGLLAVDEAHCASEWGHDFRPDYSRIRGIREFLGNPPTLALTATATPDVQREIRVLLGIEDARLFHTGIERPNLFLSVRIVHDEEEKRERLVELQRRLPGAGIVYGALIKDLHRIEEHLISKQQRCLVYHGSLSRDERRSMQDRFMNGANTRVLATNAFGMGVDKADIRSILHVQVPGSIEAYYQEVGRAGRDGDPSFCELLYLEQDLAIQQQFIDWTNPGRDLLLKVVNTLEEWGDQTAHYERDDLKVRLIGKGGHDGRVDTCLQWLETMGVIQGSFEQRDLRVVRPLRHEEIPDAFLPDKRERDLRRLLGVVEFARTDECRRVWLDRYFGLESAALSCGGCDNCCDSEEWLAASLPPASADASRAAESTTGADDAGANGEVCTGPRRGDFVRVDGRFLGHVLRVEGSGRSARVQVELASDLSTRTFSAKRHRIEVLGEA